jgi:RNase adapter protein RapZ
MAVTAKHPSFLVAGPGAAGVSTALDIFSDFGYSALAQVPVESLNAQTLSNVGAGQTPVAFSPRITPDLKPEAVAATLLALRQALPDLKILRLDAPEDILIQRYLDSGKSHSFEKAIKGGLQAAIAAEQQWYSKLWAVPDLKDYSIDTSTTTAIELHHKIARVLGLPVENQDFTVYINTFGFKYGIPQDAELMFDMRFMTNPFYDETLRPMSGLDQPVKDYIFNMAHARSFFDQWSKLIADMLPSYRSEGKTRLTIAVGCTGGKHRSVCLAEALAVYLKEHRPDFKVDLNHREMRRWAPELAAAQTTACSVSGGAKS